jgi:hydroxyacylglutathione hydrolase
LTSSPEPAPRGEWGIASSTLLPLVCLALTAAACAPTREAGARIFHLATQTAPSPVKRRDVGHGVEAVCARGTIVWIVPAEGGVVLIDAGFDDEARSVRHAVGDRTVLAVLLTHGHVDHTAGTLALDAPVFIGTADLPALRGEHQFHALAPQLGEAFGGIPAHNGSVQAVEDGAVVALGGRRFVALAMPGHTPGSTAWLLEDIAFVGDAALTPLGDEVYPAGTIFTADMMTAYDSLRRLLYTPGVRVLADAHYGALPDPQPALRKALERQHDPQRLHEFPLLRPVGCGDDPVSW